MQPSRFLLETMFTCLNSKSVQKVKGVFIHSSPVFKSSRENIGYMSLLPWDGILHWIFNWKWIGMDILKQNTCSTIFWKIILCDT